jgi:trimeric autotransporter adhesin
MIRKNYLRRVMPSLSSVVFLLVWFAIAPLVRAVVPAPDGGYPGFNTAEGQNALFNLTTGVGNTAVGWFSLWSDTDGSYNTAVGAGTLLFNVGNQSTGEGAQNTAIGTAALLNNATGSDNTATGAGALLSNIGGSSNTATGASALFNNVGLGAPSKPTGIFFGSFNTANGDRALFSNTNGNSNTATGAGALTENTAGSANTAVGISALSQNTTADQNTAIGAVALFDNTIGAQNTAVGFSALHDNSTASANTATGYNALANNTTGATNTANGVGALASNINGSANTANGYQALAENTTGTGNTALGFTAGLNITGNGNVCIGRGMEGIAGVDDTTWIKNIYTTVQPVVGTDPDVVTINSDGRLGRANVSSRRYKHDIHPMRGASEAIYALNPVKFRYHEQYDRTQTIAFGLIAEEVAEVNPDLVGRNPEGQPESVRYEQINAMLLNEFLKEHRKVAQLRNEFEATVARQQKEIQTLTGQVKEQAAQIQKVSAQLELSQRAPQTVLNNP